VFGGFGLFTLGISLLFRGNMLYSKFIKGVLMILTPLPLLTTLTFLVGFMSLLMAYWQKCWCVRISKARVAALTTYAS